MNYYFRAIYSNETFFVELNMCYCKSAAKSEKET